MENKLFIYKIIMSHNVKYYVKSLKRNKLKLSHIRGLWKKKNIQEKIYFWYTDRYCNYWFWLWLFVKSVKKDSVIEAYELIVFNLCAIYYSRVQKIWCTLLLWIIHAPNIFLRRTIHCASAVLSKEFLYLTYHMLSKVNKLTSLVH